MDLNDKSCKHQQAVKSHSRSTRNGQEFWRKQYAYNHWFCSALFTGTSCTLVLLHWLRLMEDFRTNYVRLCKENGLEPQQSVLSRLGQAKLSKTAGGKSPRGTPSAKVAPGSHGALLDLSTTSLTVQTCSVLPWPRTVWSGSCCCLTVWSAMKVNGTQLFLNSCRFSRCCWTLDCWV